MTIDEIIDEIKQANTIVVLTHETPDGDAIGSSLGVKLALEKIGKMVDVIITECPRMYDYLPKFTEIKKNSDIEKYPENSDEAVYGIVVHDYIAKYVGKLYDGSIPYEKMDHRVFRLIWEHKKVMLERIQCIENELSLNSDISKKYEAVVSEANTARMLYASHHMKRRDSVLPIIQKKLLALKEFEKELLTELLSVSKGEKLI